MIKPSKIFSILIFLLFITYRGECQSLQHPVIWTTPEDKAEVLNTIDKYDWASSVVTKTKNLIDAKVTEHQANPQSILSTIPALAADDNLGESAASSANSKHAKVLNYASYAGMLYHITGEDKYAQFAADILWDYIDKIAECQPSNTAMSGSHFYDPRSGYAQFAIAYDFIQPLVQSGDRTVTEKGTGNSVTFDYDRSQTAVYNIAMNALHEHGGADSKYGKTVSNHPILRAPGVLFPILCVDDDTERERMFQVFWEKGTKQQNSFTKTLLPMFGDQGVWPEATSYSFMQNITLVLNVVDRLKPELNVMQNNMHILDGNFLFDNLRMPDRQFVRYGDSHRTIDKTQELYRYTLDLAKRRNFNDYVEKVEVALRQGYDAVGGYDPIVPMSSYGNFRGFEQLFWGHDIPKTVSSSIDFQKTTVLIKHAGVALQRNLAKENNELYGLCGIIGGSHYVHSHNSGITMELYGAGYIMAANGGLPHTLAERKEEVHTGYFWRYAGNNTVIVNGSSHGIQNGAWNSDSDLWMNTTVNEAAEPQHLEEPINENFSFATQLLDDTVNDDLQQRTLSTIRTSETSGYYFDLFRSKSNGENKFHDYVYHNLGDEMHIFNKEGEEQATTTTDRYSTDIGDKHKSPGWRFFENTKVTEPTSDAIHIRFDLNETNTYMNLFAPSGVEKEYTKAIGPGTREAKGGYEDKKTQIITVRKNGEAWNKPFVHIIEPSKSEATNVQSVEYIYRDEVIVGAKVKSQINDKIIIDYILCQEDNSKHVTLKDENIDFKGRFAIIRKEQDNSSAQVTLYIGEGESLTYGVYELSTGTDSKAQKVFQTEVDETTKLGFKDLENNQQVYLGSNLSVEAIVGTAYSEVTLVINGETAETKTAAPYVWDDVASLKNLTERTYVLELIAKASDGSIENRTITLLTPEQWAHTEDNQPHSIPGKIDFKDYDNGGIDVSYWDKTAQNTSKYTYRDADKVDLSGSGVVTDIKTGEWLEFTINVAEEGYYNLDVKHQTRRSPEFKAITVELPTYNETPISEFIFPNTGSSYEEHNMGKIHLEIGEQVIRFNLLNYGFSLDYFSLTKAEAPIQVTFIDNENNTTEVRTINEDGTCTLPTNPTSANKTFVQWVTKTGDPFEETTQVTESIEVTAVWGEKKFVLTTTSEHGTIQRSLELDSYPINSEITLTAIPDEGYKFTGWEGDRISQENPITLTMDSDKQISALFSLATGIEEKEANLFSFYPNPCSEKVTIELSKNINIKANYKILSITGSIIKQGTFVSETEINLTDVNKGFYLLEIATNERSEVHKLLIK